MIRARGWGLSAVQVGRLAQIFVMNTPKMKKTFINPEILEYYGEKQIKNEGCLSFPQRYDDIPRYNSLKLKYFDETGKEYTEIFNGLEAHVVQHEMDHLLGRHFESERPGISQTT